MNSDYMKALDGSETAAAVSAGILIGGMEPHVPDAPDGAEAIPYAVVPKDCKLEPLWHLIVRELPRRRQATVSLYDAASFSEYVNLFRLPESRLFADLQQQSVTAIFDYHEGGADGKPRWGVHRAVLALRQTEAWKRWTTMDRKKVAQLEFAEFIESNLPDIAEPAGATILEIARTLDAKRTITFASAVRLDNGQVQFTYNEQIEGSSRVQSETVSVPDKFVLALEPFEGSGLYRVDALLRYRLGDGGRLSIGFDLVRPHLVVEDAFKGALAHIEEHVEGMSILRGAAPPVFT